MAGRGTDIILGGNPEFEARKQMRKEGYTPEQISFATGFEKSDDPEMNEARETFRALHDQIKAERAEEQQKVRELGGLCIVGTERHESRRIDNQLRGRSGRQGDPGSTQFFISLEDDLMRLFGGERMQHVMERVGLDEDEPLEAGMLTRSIEGAQKKVEGKNFGIRKYVLQYDNVMNKQREIIYGQRRMVLDGEDVSGYIRNMTYELIDGIIDPVVLESRYPEEWDLKRISDGLEQITPLVRGRLQFDDPDYVNGLDENKLRDDVKEVFDQLYEEKEAEIGSEQMREVERMILLRVVDNRWMDHIDAMDQLKDGIGLRGIGQQDPAVAYAQEGFAMFEELVADIREETVKFCYNVTVTTNTQRRNAVSGRTSASKEDYKDDSEPSGNGRGNMPGAAPKAEKTGKQETVKRDMPKVGRNDPCPCGSGKKYKNCCGRNQ
jgi:preprotein translocase subunit SecA